MYEPNIDPTTGSEIPNTIRRISDGLIIAFDITTPEYQEYLTQCHPQSPEDLTVVIETNTINVDIGNIDIGNI